MDNTLPSYNDNSKPIEFLNLCNPDLLYSVSFKFYLGNKVNIVGTDIVGRVVALYYADTGVQYLVSYMLNGEPKRYYFYDDEIESQDKQKGSIGFNTVKESK